MAKCALIPLGLTAEASDTGIHQKTYCLGTKTLIISKEEIENITKIVKYLKESDLSINAASETVENEEKSKMLDSWYVTR